MCSVLDPPESSPSPTLLKLWAESQLPLLVEESSDLCLLFSGESSRKLNINSASTRPSRTSANDLLTPLLNCLTKLQNNIFWLPQSLHTKSTSHLEKKVLIFLELPSMYPLVSTFCFRASRKSFHFQSSSLVVFRLLESLSTSGYLSWMSQITNDMEINFLRPFTTPRTAASSWILFFPEPDHHFFNIQT